MPKIGQTIKFTINLGDYNNVVAEVSIDDIDTDGDVDKQLEDSKAALNKAFALVFKAANAEVDRILKTAKGG